MISKGSNILVVAAHPDDDILGCGGLMAKYSSDCTFKVLFLAEGVSARYSEDQIKSDECLNQIKSRELNCIDALKLLNIDDPIFINYPCGRLDTIPIIEINKRIEENISFFNPDIILTHSPTDCNNDHKIIFNSVMMATRPGGLQTVKSVACFEINSSTEWNFIDEFFPNYFEEIDEKHLNLKINALEKYVDEIRTKPHPRSAEGVKTLAKYRGFKVGFNFAEAYRIIRTINK